MCRRYVFTWRFKNHKNILLYLEILNANVVKIEYNHSSKVGICSYLEFKACSEWFINKMEDYITC